MKSYKLLFKIIPTILLSLLMSSVFAKDIVDCLKSTLPDSYKTTNGEQIVYEDGDYLIYADFWGNTKVARKIDSTKCFYRIPGQDNIYKSNSQNCKQAVQTDGSVFEVYDQPKFPLPRSNEYYLNEITDPAELIISETTKKVCPRNLFKEIENIAANKVPKKKKKFKLPSLPKVSLPEKKKKTKSPKVAKSKKTKAIAGEHKVTEDEISELRSCFESFPNSYSENGLTVFVSKDDPLGIGYNLKNGSSYQTNVFIIDKKSYTTCSEASEKVYISDYEKYYKQGVSKDIQYDIPSIMVAGLYFNIKYQPDGYEVPFYFNSYWKYDFNNMPPPFSEPEEESKDPARSFLYIDQGSYKTTRFSESDIKNKPQFQTPYLKSCRRHSYDQAGFKRSIAERIYQIVNNSFSSYCDSLLANIARDNKNVSEKRESLQALEEIVNNCKIVSNKNNPENLKYLNDMCKEKLELAEKYKEKFEIKDEESNTSGSSTIVTQE